MAARQQSDLQRLAQVRIQYVCSEVDGGGEKAADCLNRWILVLSEEIAAGEQLHRIATEGRAARIFRVADIYPERIGDISGERFGQGLRYGIAMTVGHVDALGNAGGKMRSSGIPDTNVGPWSSGHSPTIARHTRTAGRITAIRKSIRFKARIGYRYCRCVARWLDYPEQYSSEQCADNVKLMFVHNLQPQESNPHLLTSNP